MQKRTRLFDTQLTGARALARRCVLASLPLFAVVGALGYVLPAHDLGNGEAAHSNFADGGIASLLVFAGVALCTYLLRNRGFGAGIGAGVIAIGGAVLALAPVLLAHMFRDVESLGGETIFLIALLGLFFVGAAALIAEPILYIVERRRMELAAKPAELPIARIVTA
jgi:hypothetical protein